MALTSESVKNSGNAGIQKAVATRIASSAIMSKMAAKAAAMAKAAGKEPPKDLDGLEYGDYYNSINKKHAKAQSFLSEIRNIYDNMDSCSMALTVQLKSVMVNARISGDMFIHGGENGSRTC